MPSNLPPATYRKTTIAEQRRKLRLQIEEMDAIADQRGGLSDIQQVTYDFLTEQLAELDEGDMSIPEVVGTKTVEQLNMDGAYGLDEDDQWDIRE